MRFPVNFHRALINRSLSVIFLCIISNLCESLTTATLSVMHRDIVSCSHSSLLLFNFNSLLVVQDLWYIRRTFIEVDHLISQDFNVLIIDVWNRHILCYNWNIWLDFNALLRNPFRLQRHVSRSLRFSLFSSFDTSTILLEYWGVLLYLYLDWCLNMRSLLFLVLWCNRRAALYIIFHFFLNIFR